MNLGTKSIFRKEKKDMDVVCKKTGGIDKDINRHTDRQTDICRDADKSSRKTVLDILIERERDK